MQSNPELELAYKYIAQTNRHLFLTGKAGTGKTTFLHKVRSEIPKRMAVVAPTGVAAINAKGVTIHSLFQLPFGTLMPERMKTEVRTRRFSAKKRDLIRGLDLLIIDEISMVRADMLDAIDAVLRYVRRSEEPFGGLQLLMIGDLHQLPPVVKDEDWRDMREVYKTSYFFASLALRKARAQVIQLKHIYRQQDDVFIGLLNKVRNNKMDQQVLDQLNSRYVENFSPDKEEGYITLSSHNNTARKINQEKLKELDAKPRKFKAVVEGDFPASMFPNEEELTFKVGAQVMFNKNDTGEVREYFNGKIGTISAINGDEITVRCPGQGAIIVEPVKWENRKYSLNKDKEVEEDVVGTYEQHPLRLAWAITIHKSQGLTFDKVVIDAGAAFAHGQVYVALSRCRTFEGIVLRTRIGDASVKTDAIVSSYSAHAEKNQPTEETLRADRRRFEIDCLKELFTFKEADYAANQLHRALFEHERAIQGDAHGEFWKMKEDLQTKAIKVGHGFIGHIERYGKADELPSKNPELTDRLKKAGGYFTKFLAEDFLPAMAMFGVMTDNKSVKMQVEERSHELIRQLFKKLKGFATLENGFDPKAYLTARANAEIDFEKDQKKSAAQPEKKKVILPKDLAHPELYQRLADWRQAVSEEREVPAYNIAHNRTLLEIAALLPTEKKSMLRINGIGPKRFEEFGLALIEIVREYLDKRDEAETDLFSVAKADTRKVTLDLFREGKTVEEIAKLRDLVRSTITTHLTHWVKQGELPLAELVDQETVDAILPYMKEHPELSLSDFRNHFKGAYDYDVLKLVRTQV
ncbi:AAA family ATPase [Neolewinella aurantiaca]|uniref:AAA family ATPase n=1 Tax=Neolewinella aurantiaca TaxID=2602767 RepID=A0A5C7FYT2_9BACT|nr:helix-turn-helix domain-containing protein [Neolewinella aurantiaca]TXF91776.1 AAA family ATPase [Neolewinella aurantiaca]